MAGITRIPRSRGVVSGLLLILLGAWGGLIPFIGPYFHYAYTPDRAWAYTTGRLWLEILPGLAALLGGLIVLASTRRPLAMFGAFVAALGGAWFVVGNLSSSLWNTGAPQAGYPVGSSTARLALEALGFFAGLGVLIVFFAALALGRFLVVGVKDAALAEQAASAAGGLAPAAQPVTSPPAPLPPSSAADTFPPQDESLQPAASTVPASTVPASTVPASTVPASTVPAGRDESATTATQFPAADSRYPAEQASQFPPEHDSFPPSTG